ncbi:MAG: universal stress protein [Bacteroidota bacterium]
MSDTKQWLIATNGTQYASEAVKHAAKLYAHYPEKPAVVILTVIEDDPLYDEARAVLEMAKYLFEDVAGSSAHVELRTEVGLPGEVISDFAASEEVDQVFIGGADFKWDVNEGDTGGVSNYIVHKIKGTITIIK